MAVPRSRWTDERLDELAERVMRQDLLQVRLESIDARLDRIERDSADFRAEMRELRGDVNALRSDVFATKRWIMGLWLSGGLVFAALFVQIALHH